MLQEAIEKIKKEMSGKDANVVAIGEYIIKELANSTNAEKLLDANKKLSGAMEHIKSKAKAIAISGTAMVEEKTVYGWVKQYYGIGGAAASPSPSSSPAPATANNNLNVSFMDLLEE